VRRLALRLLRPVFARFLGYRAARPPHLADDARALGMDVSEWQGQVDWTAAARAGVSFAFLKVTEGVAFVDSTFAANDREARALGIARGAYHFYRREHGPVEQARHFHRWVSELGAGGPGCMPPALDFEVDGVTPAEVREFVLETERLFGVRPVVSTSWRFWFKPSPRWFADYRLWVASWTTAGRPTLPLGRSRSGVSDWTFWQYTNRGWGPDFGTRSLKVDLNRYNGSVGELRAWLGLADVPG
jgi:lysozyme